MPSKRKRPGLTINILDDGEYKPYATSVAFPTWSCREIHAALNEPYTSSTTVRTLRRVGEAMGRLVGTGPDDDLFLGAERNISRASERLSMVESLLAARNIDIASALNDAADQVARVPRDAVVQAALECRNIDDFLRRLRPDR